MNQGYIRYFAMMKLQAKEVGGKGYKDSLKNKAIERLHARDLKKETWKQKSLVCTTNLTLGSKSLSTPFKRTCMFTKRL